MKYVHWDSEKNEKVFMERGVSFEDMMTALTEGKLLTIIDNPNQGRYAHQRIFVVEFNEYAYLVPFVEDKDKIFLKTIYPSRKYTKEYIEKGDL